MRHHSIFTVQRHLTPQSFFNAILLVAKVFSESKDIKKKNRRT